MKHERVGRLKARHGRVARHYDVEVVADESRTRAVAVNWTRRPAEGSMATHPGVYCLRTNVAGWDDATLWRTYTTLTDLEAVFRSMKSEFGLRPIHHRKPVRAEGHLFITVIAYQAVQVIRRRLAAAGSPPPASAPAGPRCAASSPASSASPPPSAAPTAARCTCAPPPSPNPPRRPSTTRSASIRTPAAPAVPSSEPHPLRRWVHP